VINITELRFFVNDPNYAEPMRKHLRTSPSDPAEVRSPRWIRSSHADRDFSGESVFLLI
jgi:hypothetical protein